MHFFLFTNACETSTFIWEENNIPTPGINFDSPWDSAPFKAILKHEFTYNLFYLTPKPLSPFEWLVPIIVNALES